MKKAYTCLYCYDPCTIEEKDGKLYVTCNKCGRKECTPKLIERLEARKKLER